MKKVMHILVPLLLAFALIISIGWYLFVYDRDFTRDLLLQQARYNDIKGNSGLSSTILPITIPARTKTLPLSLPTNISPPAITPRRRLPCPRPFRQAQPRSSTWL